jgi:hypothetical protein
VEKARGNTPGKSHGRHERDVGASKVPIGQPEPCLTVKNAANPTLLDEKAHSGKKFCDNIAVTAACGTHANEFPVHELILSVIRESHELFVGPGLLDGGRHPASITLLYRAVVMLTTFEGDVEMRRCVGAVGRYLLRVTNLYNPNRSFRYVSLTDNSATSDYTTPCR